MPIAKSTLAVIARLTKTKVEDLESAEKAETEVEITIDEKLNVFSEDEVTVLKNNEYKNGKDKGVEMAVKDAKERMGLDFTGKTIDGLLSAAQKKALEDAKIEPAKQVQELQEKLKTVQVTASELQAKLTEKETEVFTVKTQSLIVKELPANTTLPPDKVLLLMKADGYDYKNEDGKIIWHKDGKALTDKLGNNLATKDVASEYVTTNKLIAEAPATGGRGGNDKNQLNGSGKMSELKKQFTDAGKSLLGTEFSQAVAAAVKEDSTFDLNN